MGGVLDSLLIRRRFVYSNASVVPVTAKRQVMEALEPVNFSSGQMIIRAQRIDLVPLTPPFLRAALDDDLAVAARILGLSIPESLADLRDVCALRLHQLEAEPALQPWLLRAIALRETRMMIGHIGFHTAPGAEYLRSLVPEGVEFGFTVFSPFRRRGYAREASRALMHWAHQNHGTTRFVLSIRPDNVPSQALAASLRFVRIGSHIDEVDGPEDILEHRLSADALQNTQ